VESALQIVRREQGGIGILELRGRLETSLDPALLRALEGLSRSGRPRVVLDCSGLDFLGSGGVSAFVAVLDDLRAQGGDLKLSGVKPGAARVLDRLGISKLIQRFATAGEAAQAFGIPIEEYLAGGALGRFVASPDGGVFHASECAAARKIRQAVSYLSKKAARDAGLRACRRCS
jgi:anti-sigma B factor antagonist